MEELEFGKSVVGWVKTSSKNSNQVLVGLGLEHRNVVQCQVFLQATCCGRVLPAAKRGWNTLGSHNDRLVCNCESLFLRRRILELELISSERLSKGTSS